MYNYFTLLDCLEDTLSMLKASSACCIVLKENGVVINVNKPACDLLKIKEVSRIGNDTKLEKINLQLCDIIHEFLNGKTVFYEELKCADCSFVFVNLKVELFLDLKDLFILRFNQISDAEITSKKNLGLP